jgi:hypothetical protein
MLLNEHVVIYFFFLITSVFLGGLACAIGLWAYVNSRGSISHEKRRHIEKYLYLSRSAVIIGTVVRIVMVPLWFAMLYSLVSSISGAMCLTGIHQNVPVYSWGASSLKILLPGFYFTLLLTTLAQRRNQRRPLFKTGPSLMTPLLFILILEAAMDIKFITSLNASPVTCCTTLFVYNTQHVPPLFTENHWHFVTIFLAALLLHLIWLFLKSKHPWVAIAQLILSFIFFVSLPLALHTKLSPLILETPFHHCVFCLLQNNMWVLFGVALLLSGLYLFFAHGIMRLTQTGTSLPLQSLGGKLRMAIFTLYGSGILFVGIPTIIWLR